MRKVRTKAVILGDSRVCRVSVDWVTLLFSFVSSFRDTLYLSLEGSVRMLLLLPNSRVPLRAVPVQGENGEGGDGEDRGKEW